MKMVLPTNRTGAAVFAAFMVAYSPLALAEATDGQVSKDLSHDLLCQTAGLLEGDIGLLIGLILVFMGLWSLIQGGKIAGALPVIILGALITALPSLILSAASGLGDLMVASGMSKSNMSEFIQDAEGSCPNLSNTPQDNTHQPANFAPSESPKSIEERINSMGPALDPLGVFNQQP